MIWSNKYYVVFTMHSVAISWHYNLLMIRMAANRLSNLTKVISSHPQSKLLTLSSQFASFTTNSTINSNLTTSISSKFKIL